MESCFIEYTFDGVWVLQENKKGNPLPVETLLSGIAKEAGEQADIRVMKKNYTTCRLIATLPEEQAAGLEACIQEFLRRNWEGEDAVTACTFTVTRLTPEEAARLLEEKEEKDALAQRERAKRAAVSSFPGSQEEAVSGQETPSRPIKALDAIRQLIGAEEFKALAEELAAVAPQIGRTRARRAFSFQHYLFSIGDGCGLTTALERLADLVKELGLASFAGKRGVLEISLDPAGGEDYEILQKKLEAIRHRSRYVGVFCLDISYWIPKVREPKFQRFLRDIGDMQESSLFVFRVPYMQADVLEGLRKGLDEVLYTRSVTFAPFSRQEYREYAGRLLDDGSFVLEEDVWPLFDARLAREKGGARFYGLDSVDKVVNEMIYRKLLRNAETGETDARITAADAAALSGEESMSDALTELSDMVGMEAVRDRILEMVAQVQLQKEMAESGRAPEKPCLHMRFVGNPGTGKTTVARLVGKILKEKGILEIGNFYEVSGRSLCGRYVGETAPKTSEICRRAYGSVLFIDESYSLYAGDDNSRDYGKEAIDTLIAEMENNRDKMVVIMSGYPDEMDTLMRANPGLAGRMPYEIRFPNYTKEQLTRIFLGMAGKAFDLDDSFRQAADEFFGSVSDSQYKAKNFSNARLARNLYERVWAKAATRRQLDKTQELRLRSEDLNSAVADREFQLLLEDKKKPMGFSVDHRRNSNQN